MLAMAHQQAGHTSHAQEWFTRAVTKMEQNAADPEQLSVLTPEAELRHELLRREAEQLLMIESRPEP